MIKKIEYDFDVAGNIKLPTDPPFDEKPYLIKFSNGWCEAFWVHELYDEGPEGREYGGFYWSCFDDKFRADLDEAIEWTYLPVNSEDKKNP